MSPPEISPSAVNMVMTVIGRRGTYKRQSNTNIAHERSGVLPRTQHRRRPVKRLGRLAPMRGRTRGMIILIFRIWHQDKLAGFRAPCRKVYGRSVRQTDVWPTIKDKEIELHRRRKSLQHIFAAPSCSTMPRAQPTNRFF